LIQRAAQALAYARIYAAEDSRLMSRIDAIHLPKTGAAKKRPTTTPTPTTPKKPGKKGKSGAADGPEAPAAEA
jgi:hypothetical protein